jgi:hypothetical protein
MASKAAQTSRIVGRSSGRITQHFSISSIAFGWALIPDTDGRSAILWNKANGGCPAGNTGVPVMISYITRPNEYTSAANPGTSPARTSGAAYAQLTSTWLCVRPISRYSDDPKSASFGSKLEFRGRLGSSF